MAEAAATESTRKRAARKPAARKSAARKTASRPATRKAPRAAVRKPARPAPKIEKIQDTVKEVAYVQLGIAGRVYDEVNARVARARKDAPKQWTQLVKRGEQVQRELDKASKGLRRDIEQRVGKIEARVDLEKRIARVRGVVDRIAKRVRKAA